MRHRHSFLRLAVLCAAVAGCASSDGPGGGDGLPSSGSRAAVARPGPREGDRIGDFIAEAVYRDDSGGVFGTRWRHSEHGMPVTVLHIQSLPQCFLHFSTPPDSDRGEPHTGEHLLLGKGARGKMLQARNAAALVGDTAYTSQVEVVYAWECAAGKESFLGSVDSYLEAMLLPDYTDEEIRREVMNLGVKKDETSGALSLEEKGTIYNEMVSAYERRWLAWYDMEERVHGENHPLSFSSGGEPAAVRTMEPHHIRDFHRRHYHLSAGIGLIAALPDSVPEREFLEHLSATARRLDALPELRDRPKTLHDIAPSRPQADRGLRTIPYPHANADEIGVALVAWPPVPLGSPAEQLEAETLLTVLGEGETSTLYARLMDSASREVPVDASTLSGWFEVTPINGHAAFALDGLQRSSTGGAVLEPAVSVIRAEIHRVFGLADGSPELKAFNDRALSALSGRRRRLLKALDSPPLFSARGGGGGFWHDHLRLVDRAGGFDRAVTMGDAFGRLREALAAGRNPWKATIARLGLLHEDPFVTVAVPSPEELKRRADARIARLEEAERELIRRTGAADGQAAMARFAAEYDAATAELDARDATLPSVPLVDDVPLVLDPSLRMEPLGGVLRGRLGVFDTLSSVETAFSFDCNGLPERLHVWLPLLPAALTGTGFTEDGKPVPYDEAARRRETEILDLSASWSMDPEAGRHELELRTSGGDLDEARLALRWAERTLLHPGITVENLPRLRDLVSQSLRQVRTTLGGNEERWVRNPAGALRFQDDALYLAATSHHAALFLLARLEARLADAPPAEEARAHFAVLDTSPDPVAVLGSMARTNDGGGSAKTPWARLVAGRLLDLAQDLPPDHAADGVRRLRDILLADLAVDPAAAIEELHEVRRFLLQRDRCRVTMTASRRSADALRPTLDALASAMGDAPRLPPAARQGGGVITRALAARGKAAPAHHALVHGGGSSAVLVLSAAAPGLDDLDDASLTDALAAMAFGGAGRHGFFMQTWGAGLAYSNGISLNSARGRIQYYAERCPDPAETMKFVTGLVENAGEMQGVDVAAYSVTNAVTPTRAGDGFESRTRAQAEDLEAGITPERIERWRKAMLAMRGKAGIDGRIRSRIADIAGRVLPGIGPRSVDAPSGSFLLIAPPHHIGKWEDHVRSREGSETRIERIHAADFWPMTR